MRPWRRRPGARPIADVLLHAGRWLVTDGPSFAFEHTRHDSLDAAERSAERIVGGRAGGEIVVFDITEPNDLPDRAIYPSG